MTAKIHVTLPDSVFEEIEICSTKMGRSPANLCAYLIEFCLATNEGFSEHQQRYRGVKKNYESFKHLLLDNMDRLMQNPLLKNRIDALLEGDQPSTEDKLRIALELRLTEDYLNKLTGDTSNGDKTIV